jgi:hypothetical protein
MLLKFLAAVFFLIGLNRSCLAYECSKPGRELVDYRLEEHRSFCHEIFEFYSKFNEPSPQQPANWNDARRIYQEAIELVKFKSETDIRQNERKNFVYFIELYNQVIKNDKLWSLLVDLEHDLARVLEPNRKHSFCPVSKAKKFPGTSPVAIFIDSFCSKYSFGLDQLIEVFESENYCRVARENSECSTVTKRKKDSFRVNLVGCVMRYVLLAQDRTSLKAYLDFGTNGAKYPSQHLDNYMKCVNRFVMPSAWPDELKLYFYFHAAVLLKPTLIKDKNDPKVGVQK